jgi:hypothetical protein
LSYNQTYGKINKSEEVEKFSVRERDRELYRMFTNLETLINASRFENERDRRKIQYQLERIMEWLF